MSDSPLVTVVTSLYNAELFVGDMVKSVLGQTYSNWEMIVVDDGSTDKSREVVQRYVDQDSRIRLFELGANSGSPGHVRNIGIKQARGKYVAFLDADDLWVSEKLEKQVTYFESSPNQKLGLLFSRFNSFYETPSDSFENNEINTFGIKNSYYRLLVQDYIPTLTVLIKKTVIDEIGVFDPNLIGTEDWDLWIRIGSQYDFYCIEEKLAYYRIHSEGISKKMEKHFEEQFKVLEKHLISNPNIPRSIKKFSLWNFYLNKVSYFLQQKDIGQFLITYSAMVRVYPGNLSNYLLPFKQIYRFLTNP
jgi:teichuronic acid biosynthesis glycosyltransferase TuaG